MPRAKRYYIPGCVWHITHRCHKKEFLLKFRRDRKRWLELLYKAKQRYGLVVLNYIVTSNHIHLLVSDDGHRDTIPKSMQMVAGQTGQEYNRRKNRRGAFWEDRYHATAIEGGSHLLNCIVYIDMNMVRTGVVSRPSEWKWSGFSEIQNPKQRYTIINYKRLTELLDFDSLEYFKTSHSKWLDEALQIDNHDRDSKWSQSIAVGSEGFVKKIRQELGLRAIHRKANQISNGFELREPEFSYNANFSPQNVRLNPENGYPWRIFE